MRITVDRYQKMVAAGVLTASDRVELIDGEILGMAPIGPRHAAVTARLYRRFDRAIGDEVIVRLGNPVDLGDFSEPEPDLVLLRASSDDYVHAHPRPADILLLIEVSDSTLAFDRGTKRELCARFAINEYWVVDVNSQRIFVHRAPAGGFFLQMGEYGAGDSVAPLAFPTVSLAVGELFA